MRILAIDPGPDTSGWVLYDSDEHAVIASNSDERNGFLERWITIIQMGDTPTDDSDIYSFDKLVIEDIQNYGKVVGTDIFDSLKWIGQFSRAWKGDDNKNPDGAVLIKRNIVKLNLCGGNIYTNPVTGATSAVSKSTIRHAVMERFSATGGGARPVIGTKKSPGPLYGMEKHAFDALALALTYKDIHIKDIHIAG